MSRMTAAILRQEVTRRKTSKVFDRNVMKEAGDEMANFFVAPTLVSVKTTGGEWRTCYEVRRLAPVKREVKESLYFETIGFAQIIPGKAHHVES